MDASSPLPIPPGYQDRRLGLIILGCFAILIGVGFALLTPLAFFGPLMAAQRLGTDFDAATAVVSAIICGLMATAMIWLGIGSMRARRWARALLLCLAWIGLIIGALCLPTALGIMGSIGTLVQLQDPSASASKAALATLIGQAVVVVIYLVIPGVALLYYRDTQVRLTCEARDPVSRWTDHCPVPVLTLCVLQTFGGVGSLLMLPIYGGVFPVAGFVLHGWQAGLLWLGLAAFMAAVARGFYRLEMRAWWNYAVVVLGLWASSLATMQRLNPDSRILLRWSVGGAVALAYLLYVRRFFRAVKDRPAAA